MPWEDRKITFQERRILFRNFSGEEGKFNSKGRRNFCLVLDADEAALMRKDGWNVRELPPREEGDVPGYILKVNVNYSGRRPPRVVLITSSPEKGIRKTNIEEVDLTLLDWADITNVDLIVNPYIGPGRETPTAYLDSLYVTVRQDELEMKYFDVPDSAQSALADREEEEDPEE